VQNVAIKRRILILGMAKKEGVERNVLITPLVAFIELLKETFSSMIRRKN
jgi:ribosomal protein L19